MPKTWSLRKYKETASNNEGIDQQNPQPSSLEPNENRIHDEQNDQNHKNHEESSREPIPQKELPISWFF